MYVPALGRFFNVYDFSGRLDALCDVDESDMGKQHLRLLIEEKGLYDDCRPIRGVGPVHHAGAQHRRGQVALPAHAVRDQAAGARQRLARLHL